jgi:dTDP-4-dehydrorhamnose 3,5-epimerase
LKLKNVLTHLELFMDIKPLSLTGAYLITPTPHRDRRGYFMRVFDEAIFQKQGLQTHWVQESQSHSTQRGIVRGLHFQTPPAAETKLVWVSSGTIFDVLVDLRVGSTTYGQWEAVELSGDNHRIVYIPKGFAHGFCTLTDEVTMHYKMDTFYTPACYSGLRWNDPTVGVNWPEAAPVLSTQDQAWPELSDFASPFKYQEER